MAAYFGTCATVDDVSDLQSKSEVRQKTGWLKFATISYWLLLSYLLLLPEPLWFLIPPESNDVVYETNIADLPQHIIAFFILGLLQTSLMKRGRWIDWGVVGAMMYSIATEAVQYLIPYRYPSVDDLLANFAGLILGWLTVLWIRRRQTRRE